MNRDDYAPSGPEIIELVAYHALLAEAEATPKPGLVDCADSGAHADMDIRTFRVSAAVLRPYFLAFAERAAHECEQPIEGLFAGIRSLGMDAEAAMRAATGGVNTHKGAIFSLGILTYVCGRMQARGELCYPERVCSEAARLVAGVERELDAAAADTHGARVFRAYGITGIRGEAAGGFPSVHTHALPQLLRKELTQNERLLLALMHLMANVDDTNVLARAGREGADYCKRAAADFIAAHDVPDAGFLPALTALNADFTARNISPGGCADLVAAAWFLDSMRPGMVP